MNRIVECVPNFSEGRNPAVIEAIAESIEATPGCRLLHVDAGRSTNRTVYNFVGTPEAVVEGALRSARTARRLIDMRLHTGVHPRIGAMDVCPFVPLAGVGMEDCVACAREFGARAAKELGIPIYLYGAAAEQADRNSLRQIRAGQYEGLPEKVIQPEWKPDFGPSAFVPAWGATAAGARFLLIAYNVNVLGTREQAHQMAHRVRETGRGPSQPGRLKAVRAIGWYVEEYGMAQVSMNLDDYRVTPPHVAFAACADEARSLGIAVAGSQVVGLLPLRALLTAAEADIDLARSRSTREEAAPLRLAINTLGLDSVSSFEPRERILDYLLPDADLRNLDAPPLAGRPR